MKTYLATILSLFLISKLTAEPFATEKRILNLSKSWHINMITLTNYEGLKDFCSNDKLRQDMFNQLAEIHYYHNLLEIDLKTSNYIHSNRTIKRILRHIEKLERKYHPEDFEGFFEEQCSLQSKIENNASHYGAGFGTHSLGSKVYAQEVEMYRYLKQLTRRINKIKEHVEDFYLGRTVWEN
ncbi:MAG: hypothetical protein RIC35_04380 [Marinoscillum sp.]